MRGRSRAVSGRPTGIRSRELEAASRARCAHPRAMADTRRYGRSRSHPARAVRGRRRRSTGPGEAWGGRARAGRSPARASVPGPRRSAAGRSPRPEARRPRSPRIPRARVRARRAGGSSGPTPRRARRRRLMRGRARRVGRARRWRGARRGCRRSRADPATPKPAAGDGSAAALTPPSAPRSHTRPRGAAEAAFRRTGAPGARLPAQAWSPALEASARGTPRRPRARR